MVFSATTPHFFCSRPWPFTLSPLQTNHSSLLHLNQSPLSTSFPISNSIYRNSCNSHHNCSFALTRCRAAKQQRGSSVKKRPQAKKRGRPPKTVIVDDIDFDDEVDVGDNDSTGSTSRSQSYQPSPLPKPPAGFVLDPHGKVLMASSKRIATIVDSTNNFPLECIIRRVFKSSQGDDCMLLCPVDTPVQILKSTNVDGWSAVSDEEVESILPTIAYSLAKIHMHLVISGFCYTARGGFCYSEENIFEFGTGKIYSLSYFVVFETWKLL
uniref:Uncharacterized protein n=1 Tax=Nelumbo nucifera TaxID=4432 RepID=A0A822Y4Z6_NELNU|nr:TPA_asm: hypothetical protein HUJ06_026142 [Nelumbo nucifera]